MLQYVIYGPLPSWNVDSSVILVGSPSSGF